ncbi:MAG: MarR family winged helix-turn-helix transcriptional regulator [Pseudomonadales bacterium]
MSQEHPLRIGFLIHDVSRLRRTVADKALKPLGITRSQSWVLAFLGRKENAGLTQSELAIEMHVAKVTLGGLIDRLEESGHVERRKDPKDRRAYRLFLTGKGKRLIRRMQKVGEDLNQEILNGIPDKDVVKTEKVLAKMKEALLEMDAVAGNLASGKVVGD